MKESHSLHQEAQKSYVVSTYSGEAYRAEAEASMKELCDLVHTMGLDIAGKNIINLKAPHAKFFLGTGKVEEISQEAQELGAECIIFDQDLSPRQQRNLEQFTGLCVIDRQEVILQIFADRASTKEAVLQVTLARLEYSLPRLTRAWTHLSRQRGGTRGTRGEGEKQLEIDRRIAVKRIAKTKEELKKVKSHRETQRKQRRTLPIPTGAIVGYTNSGKSSLLNTLSCADVLVEDKLFATLDPTTKKVLLPGGSEILLTDTVGFIRNLPHDLIEAFTSTLEESVYSDFLVIMLDASDPQVKQQYETTMEVLRDLSCLDRPIVVVFNKIDLCDGDYTHLNQIRDKHPRHVCVSVREGIHMDLLVRAVEEALYERYEERTYSLPVHRFDLLEYVRKHGRILSERYDKDSIEITAQVPPQFLPTLQKFA